MLVGDQDRIEVTQSQEVIGKGTRVDEDSRVRDLDEEAGVAEVSDAHTDDRIALHPGG